LPDNMHQ